MEKLTRSQVKYRVARARSEKRPAAIRNVDLSGVNLSNLDLRYVTFSKVKCYDTTFERADLREAVFIDCDLSCAGFWRTDARGITFYSCVVDLNCWYMADLTGMDFYLSNAIRSSWQPIGAWLAIQERRRGHILIYPTPAGWEVSSPHGTYSLEQVRKDFREYDDHPCFAGYEVYGYEVEGMDKLLGFIDHYTDSNSFVLEALQASWRRCGKERENSEGAAE